MHIPRFMFGAALASAFVFVGSVAAGDDRPPPREPPPEAFTACDSKAQGDACTVALRDFTVTGTCRTAHDDDRLVCVPKHMPPPPPED